MTEQIAGVILSLEKLNREEAPLMEYDYKNLIKRMKEKRITQNHLATEIGIKPTTLSLKLSNKGTFKQNEMHNICEVLGIEADEIGIYFFAH